MLKLNSYQERNTTAHVKDFISECNSVCGTQREVVKLGGPFLCYSFSCNFAIRSIYKVLIHML